jgi:predicted kinase
LGSGKSTVAQLFNTDAICCADDYFMTIGGDYIWIAEKVSAAHEWCQNECRNYMKAQTQRIIIANTNTTAREMQPYMNMARQFGYKTFSLIIENRHGGVDIHNVPAATLEKMRKRFEIKL